MSLTFKDRRDTIKAAVLAGAVLHSPSFKPQWVMWDDEPAQFSGKEGRVQIAFTSCIPEMDDFRDSPDEDSPGDLVRKYFTGYRAQLQCKVEHPRADQALDLADKIRQTFVRYATKVLILADIKCVRSGHSGITQHFDIDPDDGRRRAVWVFEIGLRFLIQQTVSDEGFGTIETINTDVKLFNQQIDEDESEEEAELEATIQVTLPEEEV
jgi:hypothetical protein